MTTQLQLIYIIIVQRRTSPAALSVILCHRITNFSRRTYSWESYTREQNGLFNCSNQAVMTMQTDQFYSKVTFCLCGTKGRAAKTLENQLENLKYSTSWNPRGRILVVATDSDKELGHLLAAHIFSILWQVARIVNVVVLIPNQFAYRPQHTKCITKQQQLTG